MRYQIQVYGYIYSIWTFNIPADEGDQIQVCASGSSTTDRLGLGPQNCESFTHVAGSGDITIDIDVP